MKTVKTIVAMAMIGGMTLTPIATMITPITVCAATKTALSAVDNAHWGDKKDEEEGYYAHWDAVENAKKYEITLYYINDNDGYSKVTSLTTTGTSVNLKGKMTKTADYVFKIRAVGTGKYSNSSWSDYTDEVYYEKTSAVSAVSTASSTSTSNSSSSGNSNANANGAKGPTAASDKVYQNLPGVSQSNENPHWMQNEKGWWCATNDAGSTWYANGWYWIDGNRDGVFECYYFDGNGYTLLNTMTPDGYYVNGDGAWIVNGVVQTK